MVASALLTIVTALTGAYILSELTKPLGLPRSIGQILTGIILGIGLIKVILISSDGLKILSFLANLGVILLFYYVGLETNLKIFQKNIKKSLWISLCNTTIPFFLGFSIMKFFLGFDVLTSTVIGLCLSVSAQAVAIDILEELKLLKSRLGTLIITTGAIDDILELLIVTVIISTVHITVTSITLAQLGLNILIFLGTIVICRIWLLPVALKVFDKEKSSTVRFTGAMILVLLIVGITEFLDLGAFLGAIVAGIMVRQTITKDKTLSIWEEHDITRSIHILAFGFLVPLFFVWIGLQTNISILNDPKNLAMVLLLTCIATIGTILGTILAIKINKGTVKEGYILGWGMNAKGDIELVIATLAVQNAIITKDIFTQLVLMSLTTTIISPIIFKKLLKKNQTKIENALKKSN